MKTITRLAAFAAVVTLTVAAPDAARAQSAADEAAVRTAVEAYLTAHATGSSAGLRPVFHPVANLYFVRDDTLATRSGQDYLDGMRGTPAPDEAQRRRWISMVDVTGDAAVARVVLDYPTATITDYFALLRIEGEWRIVNKIFSSQPKNPQ